MKDCIFCKIIAGEIPSQKIYEDEYTYAFMDIQPQVKKHALVIPKTHVSGLNQLMALSNEEHSAILKTCAKVAMLLGLQEDGYRVVSNCGKNACQSVPHLHFHVMGGEELSSKMG